MTLYLRGPFQLIAEDGSDVTPKGAKTRALLALLAVSPGMRKGRRWIEQQLWSTRAPEQARNSLRQALSEARRTLGDASEALGSDRQSVWLETGRVSFDDDPRRGAWLEDLIVADPAFTAWKEAFLGDAPRPTAHATPVHPSLSAAEPLSLHYNTDIDPGSVDGVLSEMIASSVATTIAQNMRLDQVTPDAPGAECGVRVSANIMKDGAGNLGILKVLQPRTGAVLYSQTFRFMGAPTELLDSEALSRITFEASETVAGKLPLAIGTELPETKAAALSQLALHRMFSFDDDAMNEAEHLLERAYEADRNGLFLAWRALLQMIRSFEDIGADRQQLREVATELMWRAEEQAGENPLVQSLCAVIRIMLFRAYEQASHAAQRAMDASPNNPFALQAAALVHLRQAKIGEAYTLSSRARNVALNSKFRHWWDIQHATVCIAAGRFQEALGSAETALGRAPNNRPMQRQLIGLYAQKNALEQARSQCEKLQKVEPDFSLDRMINDEHYPVLTLRKSGLMDHVARIA